MPFETTLAVSSLTFGGVMERYPNIRCWTPHGGGYVPYQFGRADHGYEWRPEPKVVINKKPSTYLASFKFDIIAHSKPALNYLVQTFGPRRSTSAPTTPSTWAPPTHSARLPRSKPPMRLAKT